MSGNNSWILHTPDDGRKQLYVAPGTDGANWDWSKQTQFMPDGNVNVSGNITAAGRNILGEIDELKNKHICVNQCGNIRSQNGRFYLAHNANGDGLLAVAKPDGTQIWNNGSTPGTPGAPYQLVMQGDGNLVIYNKNGASTWASDTNNKGRSPYTLYLDDNGKLSIIDATGLSIWSPN